MCNKINTGRFFPILLAFSPVPSILWDILNSSKALHRFRERLNCQVKIRCKFRYRITINNKALVSVFREEANEEVQASSVGQIPRQAEAELETTQRY